MTRRRVVITGAHSYLGSRAVAHLLQVADCEIYALVTPWAEGVDKGGESDRLHYLSVDLTQALAPEVVSVLASADRVLHLAWVRGRTLHRISRINEDIIDRLMTPIPEASRFYFMSSVAAGPRAVSTYGRAKWEGARLVAAKGGNVLVCGLVVEARPRGPYKVICNLVERSPLAFRLTVGVPRVFAVHIDDIVGCIERVVLTDLAAGNYRMFMADCLDFNQFISIVEDRYPRGRIRFRLNTALILKVAEFLKIARLAPSLLCDRVLTFLHKDEAYVLSHQEIPGVRFRRVFVGNRSRGQ